MILVVWLYFWVPETKGVPMEEMDKTFGDHQGEEDLRRILEIRQRLGMDSEGARSSIDPSEDKVKADATTVEYSGKGDM
jgi:hypothetical protein